MRTRDLDAILKDANENFDGDLDVAIARHLMGDAVIIRSGGAVPAGADYDLIAEIKEKALAREKVAANLKAKADAEKKNAGGKAKTDD